MKEVYKTQKILAQFNENTIRVYQAYNSRIADEAVRLGTFGPSFKMDRMTWIKPSFLWMMYRSGWATKKDQERILAIDIKRTGFQAILENVVLSTFEESVYGSYEDWRSQLEISEVRCQWDPDRDIYGDPLDRRAIQLGLKGNMVKNYVNDWIVKINDITEEVIELRESIKSKTFEVSMLPSEHEYPLDDGIKTILGVV
ncbi:hypothetical protein C2W64_04371 [Brevibacillus laterosporus]|uniref:DUF4291 domain-containing protein n=1 Tax=Brevibacillus laterosporus TaxID=1465 RepID=A0A518V7N2_BRELA|nr:DUF4291 domain-containing protein [Brevibacillus laterosporus]QDX92998.1 DUF4291 domain-containing protein [Brevibacillus laterosporus]RAP28785.1 hypothetical protein C2W64_04371 [Brevibacillus laterosporus]